MIRVVVALIFFSLLFSYGQEKTLSIETVGEGLVKVMTTEGVKYCGPLQCNRLKIPKNQSIELIAMPERGFELINWGGRAECYNPHKPCDLYMSDAKHLTIVFGRTVGPSAVVEIYSI